ncbi:uncharacterized protein [Anabrus simplex]|uniref:uncharacterized protein n=1 Tax=Anabrus simplex TaxID=316456 RepID=UPI0035A26E78
MSLLALVMILVPEAENLHLQSCSEVQRETPPQFSLSKACALSLKTTVANSRRLATFYHCELLARRKNGLAFNFNPQLRSCRVYGCPDTEDSETFLPDPGYDYYSRYLRTDKLTNYTCVPNVGMFHLHKHRLNYTMAFEVCLKEGSTLADVTSEVRTNGLSRLIEKEGIHEVYVGMDDMAEEGRFVSAGGAPLNCVEYRAWAPREPRVLNEANDCVVLNTRREWRVVNCGLKLPFLCELVMGNTNRSITNVTMCHSLPTMRRKLECWEETKKLHPQERKNGQCPKDFQFYQQGNVSEMNNNSYIGK